MTIDWQVAGTPSTGMQFNPSDLTFTNLLFNFLIPLEAPEESQRLTITRVPVTHKVNNVTTITYDFTIGVGFDLRTGGATVQDAVFDALGLVPSVVAMATTNQAPSTSDPNYAEEEIEYNYTVQLLSDINSGTQAAADNMNFIMQQRYNLYETNEAYQNFVNNNKQATAPEHSQFAFDNDSEVYGVFQTLWQSYYQPQIFNKFPALQGTNFVDSREEEALADMVWNGGTGLLGPHLQQAINSGNAAEAWFQIRYESNGSGNLVNAGRRYYDAQVFGLFDNPLAPTQSEALQAYEMLTTNRATIIAYEQKYGADPDGASADTAANQINSANTNYGLMGTPNQVQTLAEVFDPAAQVEINALNDSYGSILPQILVNDSATGSVNGAFDVRSTDIFVAPTSTDITEGFATSAQRDVDAMLGDPGSKGAAEAYNNHVLIGTESGDTLVGGFGSDVLVAQSGNELLEAGVGPDTLIAASGNDTIQLGSLEGLSGASADVMDFVFPTSSGYTETVYANGSLGLGTLDVNGSAIGANLTATGADTWTDQSGNTYQFFSSTSPLAGYSPGQDTSDVGEMQITLGGQGGNQIDIYGFNLADAEFLSSGFFGIQATPSLYLTAYANAGVDPPAPDFTAGSTQSYTVSVDAPSTSAQTITLTLSGAPASDFGLVSGSAIVPLNSDGTFTVTIAAGQTSAAFSLVNTGDVDGSATLQLVASMANPDASGQTISSTTVTQSYVEPALDPFADNAASTVASTPATDTGGFNYNLYSGGSTAGQSEQMVLSGGNNYVVESGENDFITEDASGSNIILGTAAASSNDILLNGATTVAQAIAQEANDTVASGQRGDAVATGADNDTIVGGAGDSLYLLGQGSNVIYTGAGNDSVVGGYYTPSQGYPTEPDNYANQFNWTTSLIESTGENLTVPYGIGSLTVPTSYAFLENGLYFSGSATTFPDGSSDTVIAGNGNDYIDLEGSNNYVVAGSGLDTIVGGAGDNTIFGGSGASTLIGGGVGNDYIDTGTGDDMVVGGGGDDTVMGGGGNDTIFASSPTDYLTSGSGGTSNNYVDGGTGNDLIFGSSGSDTLIAGDGNTTIFGGNGAESIVGGTGTDFLQGGTGSDTIEAGGGGNDTLIAVGSSSSTNYVYGGTGSDLIEGGSGINVLYAGDGGTAALATSVYADQSDASATTTIYGGLGVDQLVGGPGTTVIYAGDGGTTTAPTIVVAGSGNTTVYGGLGVDNIQGGSGTDVLYAGDGGDDSSPTTVIAGSGVSTLYGGAGAADLEDTAGGSDQLIAGSGDDTLIGSGNDTLTAGSGADYLVAFSGNETYDFGSVFSDDVVSQSGGTANLVFGSGIADTDLSITAALTTTGQALLEIDDGGTLYVTGGLTGTVGSVSFASGGTYSLDQLISADDIGDGVDQTVQGASGVLTLSADDGAILSTNADDADTISAWGDNDTVGVSQTDDEGSTVFVGGSYAQVVGGSGADSLTAGGYGDSITAGSGNQVLAGTGWDDVLTGGSGQDALTATGEGDTLIAGTGVDTLVDGTGGADTFVVNNSADVIQVNAANADDTVEASASFVLPTNVDTLILEGSSNLTGTGNDDAGNLIEANSGNDTLIAGTGSDTLVGGSGDDVLVAGSGNDVLEGGTGSTTYVLDAGFGPTEIQPESMTDTIQFGVGISASDLTVGLTTDSNGNPALLIQDGSSSVTVDGGLAGSIHQFAFADGAQLTLAELLADATVVPGSLVGSYGDASINTTAAASLSATGNDTVLGTGASDTLTAGSGTESLLASGDDASVIGGSGTQWLVGAGNADTVVGGNGNQQLSGFGTAEVLVGGIGNDTLVGGAGYDTLVAGTGSTVMYGGAQADSIVLTAGGIVTFNPSSTSTTELIELPTGMTLSDFTTEQGTDGELILQSLSGNTSMVINGFYGADSTSKLWMVADSTGDAVPLSELLGSSSVQPPTSYAQEIADLQQEFEANLTATLNQIGQQGGTIQDPAATAVQGPGDTYQFNGVSMEDVTAQDGVANLGNSENNQTTSTVTQTGTTTYAVTTPTYGEVTVPGWQQFIPDSSLTSSQIETMDSESGVGNAYGFSVQATADDGNQGFEVGQVPTTEYEQTGTTTTVETVPKYTLTYQETQSFTTYNVTGDGGNDVIATGPVVYSEYGGDLGPYFVGTVDTGNGNVSVNLGMNNNYVFGLTPNYYPGTTLPLGAFIEAGSGNDMIIGTGGADVIAAGTGSDSIVANFGSTVYVPLEGTSSEEIYIQGPYYGTSPSPMGTLVLPDGITPQDLQYHVLTNVSYTDPVANENNEGDAIEITYGDSSVLMPYDLNKSSYLPSNDEDIDGIDTFQFSNGTVLTRDQIIAMAGTPVSMSDFNPTVTGQTIDMGAGQAISASLLFGGSDTDGNAITSYQISNTGTGGGYFELNGVAQTAGQSFTVNAGDLSALQYVAGTLGTSDSIQVSAFDGVLWSAAATATVNAVPGAFFEASGADQTVTGSTTGPDILIGDYDGDTLIGASGQDTFEYEAGSGAEVVTDTAPVTASSNNVLVFGTGITDASLTLNAAAGGELVLSIDGTGDSVTIMGFDPLNPLQSFPIQWFDFSDGTSVTLSQLLADSDVTGSSGSIDNADGSVTTYAFTPSGQQQVYSAKNVNASGQVTATVTVNVDGSEVTNAYTYNTDGTHSDTVVSTPAGGASTTTVLSYNATNQLVSKLITNPDGSTDAYTYNAQGQRLTADVTSASGATTDSTFVYNADGSYTDTVVATPAGGASTTTVLSYNATDQLVSKLITNPDSSTDAYTYNAQGQLLTADVTSTTGATTDSTFVYNADGSYTDTVVATPAGGASTTTVLSYNATDQLVSKLITNPDGSTDAYTYNAQGQLLTADVTSATGATTDSTFVYNADGSYTDTVVATPAGGASTTTVLSYNATDQLVSKLITNPDGSTDAYTYSTAGQVLTADVTSASGATTDSTFAYNADGSYTDTVVSTPAGGGASTTTTLDYNAAKQLVSKLVTNPDGSTDTYTYNAEGQLLTADVTSASGATTDSTFVYNADGSYTDTVVATPYSGSSSTTTAYDYSAQGSLTNKNTYVLDSNGSYTDTWSQADGSHGTYWWNSSTSEYESAWYDSNGSSWTDTYQYASGGSPGAAGDSFTETYSASDGDHGTRQYNASTGTITLNWDSSATGALSGTMSDSGFIGLQNQGELTNSQPDLTFFNPNVSPDFQAFLAAH